MKSTTGITGPKMPILSLLALVPCICVCCSTCALAFYNPTSGKWLSRDPASEEASHNLYAMVDNHATSSADVLGLASLEIKLVRGSLDGMVRLAGHWSQPYWAGHGWGGVSGWVGKSTVSLNNDSGWVPWDGWYCNTVNWTDPLDANHTTGDAGALMVYLSDPCGGRFRVSGWFYGYVTGHGPASKYAQSYLHSSRGSQLADIVADNAMPEQDIEKEFSEEVFLQPNRKALVVEYHPILAFSNRAAYGGRVSSGYALGRIEIDDVAEIR